MKLLLRLQVTVWELIMIMIITHQRAVVADMETDIIHQHQGKYNRYFYFFYLIDFIKKNYLFDMFIDNLFLSIIYFDFPYLYYIFIFNITTIFKAY